MKESAQGNCSAPGCVYGPGSFMTDVHRLLIFIGAASESGPWFCAGHYAAMQSTGASFEVEQPVIDMSGPPNRRVRNTSRKRELQIAESIGGRRQPGSGNQPFTKGDVRRKGDFRVEAKECFGLEFKVNRRDLLDKIRAECSRGEHPAVVITFRDKGTHQELESWAMVPYQIWEERIVAGKNR
jgi:hypothetical protein